VKLVKYGRKWRVEGDGEGWIFKKTFPAKWKAELATQVFQKGGRVSDYWKKAREQAAEHQLISRKVLARVRKALARIIELAPTCPEIDAYPAGHGAETHTDATGCFTPKLHDTWQIKPGGRVHIDIGCCGRHLMLNAHDAEDFIRFIEKSRKCRSATDRTS